MNQVVNLLPNKNSVLIKKTISLLGIDTSPFYIRIVPYPSSEYGSCFDNVIRKVEQEFGEVVYGWQFCEYEYMIEAEFHAVWKSPAGEIIDITSPARPDIKEILFVVDGKRKFTGESSDNFRFNKTSNKLVDDIIDVEKAKFRFLNRGERKYIVGELSLNAEDKNQWWAINQIAGNLEEMYFNAYSPESKCFCDSGKDYEHCHRILLMNFLNTV
jgi:hypothetical protein